MGLLNRSLGYPGRGTRTEKRNEHSTRVIISTNNHKFEGATRTPTNLFAEFCLHLPVFRSFGATIAAIPGTAFVVVDIIAIAVSLVVRLLARWFRVLRLFARRTAGI